MFATTWVLYRHLEIEISQQNLKIVDLILTRKYDKIY